MKRAHRIIWLYALGYFAFYAPYAALIKVVTAKKMAQPFELLPATIVGTVAALLALLTFTGWWRYARRPSPALLASGISTAVIIGCTTLAYTFDGISIVFALLLMRGGVLILAPLVDAFCGRTVRWFAWMALALSLAGIVIAIADVRNYTLTLAAAVNLGAYLLGYVVRLPCMTRCAKVEEVGTTRAYFVTEMLVAIAALTAFPFVAAAIFGGAVAAGTLRGATTFWSTAAVVPALLIGACYAALYWCGTLVYLDRRENTFCIPLNRAASLLAGVAASAAVLPFIPTAIPSAAQFAGAALILCALFLLSPLHHLLEVAHVWRRAKDVPFHRVFLFVCSGNTSRSAMAAAIGNAELAQRLEVAAAGLKVRATSAGTTAVDGKPMTELSMQALQRLSIAAPSHASRALTNDLAAEADRIYCMTRQQAAHVVQIAPAAAAKCDTLDPDGDIPDPSGGPIDGYVECALRIQRSIRKRFDEIGLAAGMSSGRVG